MRVLFSDLSQNRGEDGERLIFSESYRRPRQGSPCGSWRQPPPCSRRGSCACPSSDEVHRRDSHSGSRTLTRETSASECVDGAVISDLHNVQEHAGSAHLSGRLSCGTWSICSSWVWGLRVSWPLPRQLCSEVRRTLLAEWRLERHTGISI